MSPIWFNSICYPRERDSGIKLQVSSLMCIYIYIINYYYYCYYYYHYYYYHCVIIIIYTHTHILYHPYQYIHYTYFALWWSFLFLVQKSPATSKKSSHETFGATELSGIDRKSQ